MRRFTSDELTILEPKLVEWYYNQAFARHNDLIRIESIITERGYTLLTIYLAVLTASVGYILTHLTVKDDLAITAGGLAIIVFSTIATAYIYQVIKPHPIYLSGKDPDKFNIPLYLDYFKNYPTNQFNQVICDELRDLQNKIDNQESINLKRVRLTSLSIRFMLFGIFVSIVSFLLAFLLY